jgi:hypothetical protein
MDKRSEDSRKKGDIAEKLFELECIKRDIDVYKPVSSGGRVDYLACIDGEYKKVQIKYISTYKDKILISFTKNQNGRKDSEGRQLYKKYNSDEIDLFLVYCPDTNEWYSIPMKLAATYGGLSLNTVTTPKKNNQTKGVRYSQDYIWK